MEKAKREVDAVIKSEGERATFETGVRGLHPELVKMLGRLHYRTSYGQNVLRHSIEVSQLAGMMAAELGADVQAAKRAGLLHDLGKSVDHEMEGSHVALGVEFARKYREREDIIHAIQAHHGDVEPRTLVACLVQAADAISAARPGARRENLENYIKRLEQLETIAGSFKGVEKSYAIQAGREIRVMVKPEEVSEDEMVLLARDLAKKIEEEMEYPGQIKVNVLRETKAIEYAKGCEKGGRQSPLCPCGAVLLSFGCCGPEAEINDWEERYGISGAGDRRCGGREWTGSSRAPAAAAEAGKTGGFHCGQRGKCRGPGAVSRSGRGNL